MSNGEGPQGHLYPAFPYDAYTLMSDQEIVDLFAALKAVAPVAEPAPPHEVMFPFNIRLAMAGWKNLFFQPAALRARSGEVGGMEPRRLSRQRSRPLRDLPLAAQPASARSRPGKEFTGNQAGGPGGARPSITARGADPQGIHATLR